MSANKTPNSDTTNETANQLTRLEFVELICEEIKSKRTWFKPGDNPYPDFSKPRFRPLEQLIGKIKSTAPDFKKVMTSKLQELGCVEFMTHHQICSKYRDAIYSCYTIERKAHNFFSRIDRLVQRVETALKNRVYIEQEHIRTTEQRIRNDIRIQKKKLGTKKILLPRCPGMSTKDLKRNLMQNVSVIKQERLLPLVNEKELRRFVHRHIRDGEKVFVDVE